MKKSFAQFSSWKESLGKRSLREKILLIAAVWAIGYLLLDVMALSPLQSRSKAIRQRLETSQSQLPQLEAQVAALQKQAAGDPDQENRQRLEELQTKMAALDARLQALTLELISPREMSRVLEEVLQRQQGLRLVRAENLTPEPLLAPAEEAGSDAPAGLNVYRHGLQLEFVGSFGQIVDCLRALEGIERQLIWTSFELQVEEYPRSRVVLTVHTLSLKKEWIGV
ncbi:hypothetical protein [Desulfuromonas sp. AOP6]|uniref:hypothetical protein n=1 Tax=Desulfuromonas sp. AOP6 TaxID=1566351 RepID=UPI001285E797|nr:hypothetical protein [Desulfuromonas sp. AOP6]BCA78654.1 MSHA biogenesis protein MshJ [Desulfuromonas sp. AOP6]